MKLEQVLPAYREGKTIISRTNYKYNIDASKYTDKYYLHAADDYQLLGEWEIEKEEVKKYPVLLRFEEKYFCIAKLQFATLREAKQFYCRESFPTAEVIRLITEIPELIQEEEV